MLKKFEEEELDENIKKRLKDASELPGSLWHVYETKDADKIRDFLHKVKIHGAFKYKKSYYLVITFKACLLRWYCRSCTAAQHMAHP